MASRPESGVPIETADDSILNPDFIAEVLGSTARLSSYEVLYDASTHRPVKKRPVWEIVVTNTDRDSVGDSIVIYINPARGRVGVVEQHSFAASGNLIGMQDPVELRRDVEPIGSFPTHRAAIEGVESVRYDIDRPISAVEFIREEETHTARVIVYGNGRFSADYFRRDDPDKHAYAYGIEEVRP